MLGQFLQVIINLYYNISKNYNCQTIIHYKLTPLSSKPISLIVIEY